MAAILNPVPANSPDLSSRSSARLVAGLATFVIGVAALLGSALQPDVESLPVVAPAEAAIQTAAAPSAAGHDADQLPQPPGRLIAAFDRPRADRRLPVPTTPVQSGTEPETALARGTRAESAHLATIPVQPDGWDVRWGIIAMAAAQRRDWTRRCPCPIFVIREPGEGPR